MTATPRLGVGVGLRTPHHAQVLTGDVGEVEWFEVITENVIDSHGRMRWVVEQVAERWPVVLHGVALGIGSTDPLDRVYLGRLRRLAGELRAAWVSDHLCWNGVQGLSTHELLPLPLRPDVLEHVAARVRIVQDVLGQRLVLENPSGYVGFGSSSMSEPQFLAELVGATGCGLLLDLNNVHVTAYNHDLDPRAWIEALPVESIVQIHLAGHDDCGTHLLDSHDRPVADPVWALYRQAIARFGPVPTLIEWDAALPSFARLAEEAERARQVARQVLGNEQAEGACVALAGALAEVGT
jgi:uncharacterized protein (UPF0276 family)